MDVPSLQQPPARQQEAHPHGQPDRHVTPGSLVQRGQQQPDHGGHPHQPDGKAQECRAQPRARRPSTKTGTAPSPVASAVRTAREEEPHDVVHVAQALRRSP